MDLKWNYAKGWVDIHMSGYVIQSLAKFNHPAPEKPQHPPHRWVTLFYGSRQQQTPKETSKSPLLDKDSTQRFQSITGIFIHYRRAVDPAYYQPSTK